MTQLHQEVNQIRDTPEKRLGVYFNQYYTAGVFTKLITLFQANMLVGWQFGTTFEMEYCGEVIGHCTITHPASGCYLATVTFA